MKSLEVNQNGFVTIPKGYHLHVTNMGNMLVRDNPLFKEGDIIERIYNAYYIAVVDHIDTDGCVCYKILLDLDSKQIYLNGKYSIVQDNWTSIHKGTYKYRMMEILYENCWHK